MSKRSLLFVVLSLSILVACNSKEDKDTYKFSLYRAVNKNDTATLTLNKNEKRFFGQYEITHYEIGKDSGDVEGNIVGDTLKGSFHYKTHGGSWKRVPLALLQKDNKLFLGTGVIGTYLNLPCYITDIPIDYTNPEFLFEEIKVEKK
nr:hypothetical protein [uncultured Flavobacterium sp.]